MKYLIGVIFLMLANVASALDCKYDGSTWRDVEVANNLDVNVSLYRSGLSGEEGKIVMAGILFVCRLVSPGDHIEIWSRYDGVQLEPRFSHFKSGLRVSNQNYTSPVPRVLLGKQTLTNTQVLNGGNPYITIDSPPNGYVEIPRGAKVLRYTFNIRVLRGTMTIKSFDVTMNVYAGNSLNLNPSTCAINNNNPINVDFGSVDPIAVGGDVPATTPYTQSVVLNYSCPDRGIYSPIDIKLVGVASAFNASALATTNPNLAAGMQRLSALVAPGGSFRTAITNSSGSDTVLFTLFRKTGSVPAAGSFTASATLVMSVP